MSNNNAGNQDPIFEVYRLRRIITRVREEMMATVHHLFLAATVCEQAGYPASADQMREMIDRLRLLAARLEDAAEMKDED